LSCDKVKKAEPKFTSTVFIREPVLIVYCAAVDNEGNEFTEMWSRGQAGFGGKKDPTEIPTASSARTWSDYVVFYRAFLRNAWRLQVAITVEVLSLRPMSFGPFDVPRTGTVDAAITVPIRIGIASVSKQLWQVITHPILAQSSSLSILSD
jgi:hypothetical protein